MSEQPDYKAAVQYWSRQPTTVDGMLGGYGTGRVPRLDAQHSALFLRQLIAAHQLRSTKTFNASQRPSKRRKTNSDHSQDAKVMSDGQQVQRVEKQETSKSIQQEPHELVNREKEEGTEEDRVCTVDCGAGIGRVTRDLLLHFSDTIDLVEPCAPFTETILHGADLQTARERGVIRKVLQIGLQDFMPQEQEGGYTIIWNQWCLGQLPDEDLIAYLRRCKQALRDDKSAVFVKENVSATQDIFDANDSSWTRTEQHFLEIFKQAGLRVIKSSWQHGFPKELFPVKLWALK